MTDFMDERVGRIRGGFGVAHDRPLFFFNKGRVALYAILKSLGIGPGDEIIVPGFTCVVVPSAVCYLGADPVYADIDPKSYNITVETISPLLTPCTRVILAQNTFGLSADLDPIMALAEKQGIQVVEDCAHGLGASYKGRPAGTNTHAAFFSTQWSKPISTGIGGIACVRDEELVHKVGELTATLPQPSFREQFLLWAQLLIRPLADTPALHYRLISLYRFLTQRAGLSVGSSAGQELEGTEMPAGYLKAMGSVPYRRFRKLWGQLPEKVKVRQQVARQYDDFLTALGGQPPFSPNFAEHGMLRYPVRVKNKAEILQRAAQWHIPIGDWFVSPLHPVEGDLTPWGYCKGQCPQAERACRELINLYTEKALSPEQLSLLLKPADVM